MNTGEEHAYESRRCALCGSDRTRRVHHFTAEQSGVGVGAVDIVKCLKCGVRRRAPGIQDDFEEDYHATYLQQGVTLHPHELQMFADLMTVRLRSPNPQNVHLLDVGCSTGRVLRLATSLGFQVRGFDISDWAAKHCRQNGFEVDAHPSLRGVYAENTFDIIHCAHVIEHVPDPRFTLRELGRILKPNGMLMLACPNYASLPRLIKGAAWPIWCLDSHLWFFTRRQMTVLVRQVGFEVVHLRTLHGYSPDSRAKKTVLDWAARWGWGDAFQILAMKQEGSLPVRPVSDKSISGTFPCRIYP